MVLDHKDCFWKFESYCFLGTLLLVPKGQSEFLRDAFIFGQRADLLKKKERKKKATYHHIIFVVLRYVFLFF